MTSHSTRADLACLSFARLNASLNYSRPVNSGVMRMKSKVAFRQLSKGEWQRGPYIESAMLPVSSEDLSRKFEVVFEEFWEDGLGRGKSAGFLTSRGKQFSLVEYLDAPSPPATYIVIRHDSPTKGVDLLESLEALGISSSELIWAHGDIKSAISGK